MSFGKKTVFNSRLFLTFLLAALVLGGFNFVGNARADMSTGLVGYWAFNEGSGTSAADSSGNGNTGAITSGTWSASGKIGSALDFNGTTSKVNAGSAAVLDNLANFTYSAWVNPRTLGESIFAGIIVEKAGGLGFKKLTLSDSSGNQFYGDVEMSGETTIASSNVNELQFNIWTHIVLVYNDTNKTASLYKNGSLIAAGVGAVHKIIFNNSKFIINNGNVVI